MADLILRTNKGATTAIQLPEIPAKGDKILYTDDATGERLGTSVKEIVWDADSGEIVVEVVDQFKLH